jgi:hypothetical protein
MKSAAYFDPCLPFFQEKTRALNHLIELLQQGDTVPLCTVMQQYFPVIRFPTAVGVFLTIARSITYL